jgi:rhodanese-related sulfurtransferase/DNA-binding transcriptional ArsR family regulator
VLDPLSQQHYSITLLNTRSVAEQRRFKDALYGQFARVGKAVASPRRIELLDLLVQAPRTVEALADETGQPLANVSQHLQVLRASRLVEAEKNGLYVTYRIADERVTALLMSLRQLAQERLLEVRHVTRDYFAARGGLDPVDGEELIRRVRKGEVTVLDVRPAEEYCAGHIPDAVSIPIADLKRRLAELPKRREVVAYCRGPYCVYAVDAVKLLRARGFKAVRMEDGVSEWRARGFRVDVSPTEGAS